MMGRKLALKTRPFKRARQKKQAMELDQHLYACLQKCFGGIEPPAEIWARIEQQVRSLQLTRRLGY